MTGEHLDGLAEHVVPVEFPWSRHARIITFRTDMSRMAPMTAGVWNESEVRSLVRAASLSIQLSIDPDIIRHREGELRQITLSVNDLQISCRTS
jgi:hypothetical protein